MSDFETALGHFTLHRFPASHDQSLRAWDAADQLVISRICKEHAANSHMIVCNDDFGAISIPLSSSYRVTHWTDSLLAQTALNKNIPEPNSCNITLLPSTELPKATETPVIVLRVSKNLRLLRYQLAMLAQQFPNAPVYCALMQKQTTSGLKLILEEYLDKRDIGRAEKKARVISGQLNPSTTNYDPWHSFQWKQLTLYNLPNVFSSESLDIGARFLLENFPEINQCKTVADLGCGNGVLSAFAASQNPKAQIIGFDESYMAVKSAQETFLRNGLSNGEFKVNNMLNGIEDESFDLILCNPPFHQQRRVTTDTALAMIKQAKHKLKPQGELWIIANRHLGYHKPMKQQLGNCNVVNSNPKFVILTSQKN